MTLKSNTYTEKYVVNTAGISVKELHLTRGDLQTYWRQERAVFRAEVTLMETSD